MTRFRILFSTALLLVAVLAAPLAAAQEPFFPCPGASTVERIACVVGRAPPALVPILLDTTANLTRLAYVILGDVDHAADAAPGIAAAAAEGDAEGALALTRAEALHQCHRWVGGHCPLSLLP